MNERIQQLYKQAHITQEKQVRAGGWDNDREPFEYRTVTETNFDPEKFAELIVRECITQCEQVATDADAMTKSKFVTDAGRQLHEGMWGGAKNCAAEIKEHFGVEE
jgi:hypothetical protein